MLTLVPFGFKSKKKPCEWASQVGKERRALQWLCPLRNATVATVLPLVYSSVKLCWDAHLRACKNRHAVDLTELEAEVRLIVTTSSLLSSSSSHLVQDEGPPHLILSFAPIAWWPSLFFAPPPQLSYCLFTKHDRARCLWNDVALGFVLRRIFAQNLTAWAYFSLKKKKKKTRWPEFLIILYVSDTVGRRLWDHIELVVRS